jgi:hypothetical protein
MKILKRAILIVCILLTRSAPAQTPKNIYHDNLVWTQYLMKAQVTKKWSFHLDIGYRTHDYLKEKAQFLIRPAINYQISPSVMFQVGYAHFSSAQFLNGYPDVMRPENRTYQRLTVMQKSGRFEFRHRYRLEERFIHNFKNGALQEGSTYSTRVSYQFHVACAINNPKIADKTWYVFAFDELFVSFGKTIYNNFDQNRLATGLGYQFGKGISATIYYQYIYGQQPSGTQLYSYNTYCVTLSQVLDFRKKNVSDSQK